MNTLYFPHKEKLFSQILCKWLSYFCRKEQRTNNYLTDYFKEINLHLHNMEISSFLKQLIS